MACDWMSEGDQLVTASWDHSACLWDTHTGSTVHTLRGITCTRTCTCTSFTNRNFAFLKINDLIVLNTRHSVINEFL